MHLDEVDDPLDALEGVGHAPCIARERAGVFAVLAPPRIYDGRYLGVACGSGRKVSVIRARARSGCTPFAIWQGAMSASTRSGSSQWRYFLNLSSNSMPSARANTVR